jgi:hypothetical protein
MEKLTLKEKVLRFVEERGSARFTDIQRFIVDNNFGQGTYDGAKRIEKVWVNGEYRNRLVNPYRGYHSCSLTTGSRWTRQGYMLCGPDYLVKGENGLYTVVRTTERKVEPVVTKQPEPVKELVTPRIVTLYVVDPKTGAITAEQRPVYDRSFALNPYIFDEYLVAVDFAERIQEKHAAEMISEDIDDITQEELEEKIAEDMISEFEVEVPFDFDKQNEVKKDLNLHDIVKHLIPVKAGQEIYVIDNEEGFIARMYKSKVTEVNIYLQENSSSYEVITEDDESFGDIDLGKGFFTDKESCLAALSKLF